MRQIVCISTSNYYPMPTRKQNVMNRLSDAEILYIDPPVTYIAPLKDKKAKERIGAWKKPGQKAKANITVFAPPPVLPFFNKKRQINKRNQKRLAKFINGKIREAGFSKPVLWCYSPTSCDLVDLIENSGVVYDCVDRHSAYQGMIDPAVVDQMEKELAEKSSQVFCTAQGLYDTLIRYNSTTTLIPNGAAYELFSRAAEECGDTDPSQNGDGGKKPVFGFVGALQECINYDYICAVADAWPEGEVVLIGRSLPGVDLSPLTARSNIRLMGLVPQPELPQHIRKFDVCLNAFREGRLSKDVSPLKFYEYLATGKPIVSTGEPLQVQDFADVIHIAHTKEEFVQACADALAEHDPGQKERRMEYGRQCSWDERVKQMEQVLKERHIF